VEPNQDADTELKLGERGRIGGIDFASSRKRVLAFAVGVQ
jgi:hypothetical protein